MAEKNKIIIKNLVFLTENLSNVSKVLIHLVQEEIITIEEKEDIERKQGGSLHVNAELLRILMKKKLNEHWELFNNILRKSGNGHIADKLCCADTVSFNESSNVLLLGHTDIPIEKWWPERKDLMLAFFERKNGDVLLVEELHKTISSNHSGMAVISQKVIVSGLGGIGKTTTAKWYANYYEKEYSHIIWIDCGEGSLLKSFRKLATDLEIKDENKCFELEDLARKSFKKLCNRKCLIVFDNAECYVGNEGIRNVLPKTKNFHSIITSRNREWGNETGGGLISEFQMDVFSIEDSMDFLRKNLKGVSHNDHQIQLVCELLGNLPLALQIAVSTINRQKISFRDYVDRLNTTDHILSKNFDDYEKTINKTMKISLDLIANNEDTSGQIAHAVLLTFGYITPDDVELEFFQAVEATTITFINEAVDLLVKYSLITKRKLHYKTMGNKTYTTSGNHDTLSIHRLLQQVIRHNGKTTEIVTLRKILGCDNFIDYKLIPYYHCSGEIQKEFTALRAKLVDHGNISSLLKERRFKEAAELALIVKNTLGSQSSVFNNALCLALNGGAKEVEALKIFECLLKETSKNAIDIQNIDRQGILRLDTEVSTDIVAGQIYTTYVNANDPKMANAQLKRFSMFTMPYLMTIVRHILRSLEETSTFPNFNLDCSSYAIQLNFENSQGNSICITSCNIEESIQLPNHLTDLRLYGTKFCDSNGLVLEYFDISRILTSNINRVNILGYQGQGTTKFRVPLKCLQFVGYISLDGCLIILDKSNISPITITLSRVSFIAGEGNYEVGSVTVNHFINFNCTKALSLKCPSDEPNILLHMFGSLELDSVELVNINVIDWQHANWRVKKFTLKGVSIQDKNLMKIDEIHIAGCPVDVSVLPSTLLTLSLENVQYESKRSMGHESSGVINISHLTNLINLEVVCSTKEGLDLDLDFIPLSVRKIRFEDNVWLYDRKSFLKVDTLIVALYSLREVNSFLNKLSPENLVFYSGPDDYIFRSDFEDLNTILKRPLKTVTIGKFKWLDDEFEEFGFSKSCDRKTKYYSFEKLSGKGIEVNEFEKMVQFPINARPLLAYPRK